MDAPQLFRLSFTKLRSFDRCRKQYWFRYLSGLPSPEEEPTPALVVGKGLHRAMKALCDTGHPEDGAAALDVYLRMPKHECAGPGTNAHRDAFSLYEQGCEAHASIESADRHAELDTWVHSPQRGIAVTARVDRADRMPTGEWQLIDWKTGRFDPEEEVDQQLDISHLALRTSQRLPARAEVTAVAWNLRTGQRRVRKLVRADAKATMDRLSRVAARMQTLETFEATPSSACGICEWQPQCPEARAVIVSSEAYFEEPDVATEELRE